MCKATNRLEELEKQQELQGQMIGHLGVSVESMANSINENNQELVKHIQRLQKAVGRLWLLTIALTIALVLSNI